MYYISYLSRSDESRRCDQKKVRERVVRYESLRSELKLRRSQLL